MKQCIINLALVVLMGTGCGQVNKSKHQSGDTTAPARTNHIQLVSPSLAPNAAKAKLTEFVQSFVKRAGRGSELDLIQGETGFQIAKLCIPALDYDSSRARAKALGQPLLEVAKFLRTNESLALSAEPGINLPGLLRSLPVSEPPPVTVIVGSPWHQPKADAGFSMLPGQLLPTDDHLLASPAESPYGLAGGYTNRLNGSKVIFAAIGDMPSGRAEEALRSFWAKAVQVAGGSLVLYTRDLNRALEAALNPETLVAVPAPPLALTGELAMRSAADYAMFANRVAIVRVPGNVSVTDRAEWSRPPISPGFGKSEVPRPTTLPQTKARILTNRTVVAEAVLRTNWIVSTNFARLPNVSVLIVTNRSTNWVLTATLETNSIVTTNTVYRTNFVISTNMVPPPSQRSASQVSASPADPSPAEPLLRATQF